MSIKIIADSCCDITPEMEKSINISRIPLQINVGDHVFTDNENIDIKEMLGQIKQVKSGLSTACPSPEEFSRQMQGDEEVFCVALSSQLSGTYNSARIGAQLAALESPRKKIHVFDSQSASAGETRIAMKIDSLYKAGAVFEEVVEEVTKFIEGMRTFFVIESLDMLIKTGRMNKLVGQVASILHMRPIMGDDGKGKIVLVEKARGTQNALKKLCEIVVGLAGKEKEDTMVIAHCNNFEGAHWLKEELMRQCRRLREIVIVPMSGISSFYANDKGLVVAY